MKKRILSILLLCCMVLTLLPTAAFAAGELPDVKLSVPTKFDVIVDLTEQNKEVKIKDSKTYLIKGSTDPNWYFQYRIKIDGKNNTPHIFLDGVRLQAPKDGPAIELYGGASACLYFIGRDSELIGAENFAALQKNKTEGYLRVLVQTGTKLMCQGGHHAAGIGGSKVGIKKFSQGYGVNLHFGSLATDIYGGEIFATSGVGGAGIGGGANGGVGEQIYVYSGKLTAVSVSQGAGIGGGQAGPGRHIYIRGGTVHAGSRSAGAGIGSGDYAGQGASEDAHHIEISGGSVIAWSNYAGAGIGGGRYSSGHDISITGGVVTAQGYWGAGIGGGMNGDSGNILIKDTTLTAQSYPLFPNSSYHDLPAAAVGRGSDRTHWMPVMQNQEYLMHIEENIKIGASDGKSVWLSATGWQWRRSQGTYEWGWGTTTELLIPNEYGRVDLQRLSLPYAYNYGRVIGRLELHCEKRTCSHELDWTDRDGCHIWACKKCGARDPAAEMSKQNAKHIPGDWGVQEMRCAVCDHLLEKDTKAPVLEVLKDGESYTVEDNIDGNPGAYTFTVSDPAASGETSSGIKAVTINGEPQDGPTYRLPAPDGGNNDAGAEYTVVATDNAGNETKATVRTYRWHHVVEGDPQYKVTVQDCENGSVTVVNATETAEDGTPLFFKDELVVLYIAPDEGYMLSTLSVNGTPATVAVGDDTHTFAQPDGDVTITAAFEMRNEHTVTFDANGGSEPDDLPEKVTTAMPDKKVLHGSEYYLPECEFIAPEGKQFKAWQIDGTEYPVNAPVTVTADITVKALWEDAPPAPVEYTITVTTEGNGTASASATSATAGTEITLIATPDEGYRFKEWEVIIGGVTIADSKFIMPEGNVEVKAIFEAEAPTDPAKPSISVTGTYTYNGSEHTATVSGYDPATMDISGNTATDAGDYTVRVTSKTGKWADGSTDAVTAAWSIGKAAQEAPNGLIGVAPSTEDGSDGKITGVDARMEYRMEAESIYTACSGTEIENLFAGHYFVRYAEDHNHFASPDAEVTVGEGTPLAECTITFNAGGGSGSMDSVTVKAETNYILPACGFTAPTDQEFKAWEIGGTEYKVGDSYTVLGDTEIKALWENSVITPTTYTVTVSNDGNGTGTAAPSTAAAGTTITLIATPNTGYHFKEWQIMSGGVTIKDDKFLMPNDNVEVKAIFEKDAPPAPTEFTITFDGNGGTPSVGSMTTTDQKLTSLPSASRSGSYSFDGWYIEKSGGTKITKDTVFHANTTVYAHWTYTGGGSNYSYYTIKATARTDGSITPSGNVSVREGRDQTFTITPDKGYTVSNVKIDGRSMGAVKSYTFENVRRAHTIEVSFTRVNEFIDVPSGSYFYEAVMWAVENGVTTGVSASRFDPNGVCTRAQAVTFLWRIAGSPAPRLRTMPFTDVPVGSYYYDAVLWAVENGITEGTSDTTFSPNDTCTRAQIVSFLWRSEKSPAAGTANPFTDVKASAYYADAVLWAVKEDVTKGTTNTTFSPDANCTRAQIVTFIWRALAEYHSIL